MLPHCGQKGSRSRVGLVGRLQITQQAAPEMSLYPNGMMFSAMVLPFAPLALGTFYPTHVRELDAVSHAGVREQE